MNDKIISGNVSSWKQRRRYRSKLFVISFLRYYFSSSSFFFLLLSLLTRIVARNSNDCIIRSNNFLRVEKSLY